MKIVFLLTQSLDSPSGLGRYFPISKQLTRAGHSVTIFALHPDFNALVERAFVREGVYVRYVAQMHVRKQGNSKEYFGTLRLLWVALWGTICLTLHALLAPTDAYHIGKPHPMNGIAGVIASRIRRRPLYIDYDDYEAASNRFGAQWQRRVVSYFEDRLLFLARGITVNTAFVMQRLAELGYPAERMRYVPNGVDRERFTAMVPDGWQDELGSELMNLRNQSTIVYVGSMSLVSHAVDLLVHAFVRVLLKWPSAELLLVGGGENLPDLMRLVEELGVSEHVHFVGRVAEDRVPLYYGLGAVSVDPVYDDLASRARCPLKLFESWAMQVPCITGDVGDRRELMGNPMAGRLAAAGDAESLATEILFLLENPRELELARVACQSRVQQFFWDRLMARFAEVYDV